MTDREEKVAIVRALLELIDAINQVAKLAVAVQTKDVEEVERATKQYEYNMRNAAENVSKILDSWRDNG